MCHRRSCKKVLETSLFALNSTFQKSILSIRKDAATIADGEGRIKLYSLEPKTVYKLEEFTNAQEDQAGEATGSLQVFHGLALATVTETCETMLAALQEKLLEATQSDDDPNKSGMSVDIQENKSKFSYTVLAQQRAGSPN